MSKGVIIESETLFRVVDFDASDAAPVIDGVRYAARQIAGLRIDGVHRGFVLLSMEQDPAIEYSEVAMDRAKALAMRDSELIRPYEVE